jgi:hypothetical protein
MKRKSKRRRRTKKKDKKDNKENKNSARAERKRKRSPARSTGRSITPIPEFRLIVIKPKNRIAAPPNNSYLYVPTLTPPTCIPNIISPINYVPNSPEAVQLKSPSIATICLDEPFQPTIVTDIVNNRDDFNNIVKRTEVKAESSTSAKSINEEETCISLFATGEYVPALKADETREEMTYEPTPKHILQLKTMADCQKSRIILIVGGSRFETCVPTLQSDPSSILSYMVLKESPMKPYSVDNIYTYFLDRDPVILFIY